MTPARPRTAPRTATPALLAGAAAGLFLLAGVVAGGLGLAIHGLGYFAAFPFWFFATVLAVIGVWSSLKTHGHIDHGDLPAAARSPATVGFAGSSIVLFFAGILTLALCGLLALAALVAVGMLLSHPL